MIDFQPITVNDKETYEHFLLDGNERGCGYSFSNLFLWGRQNATVLFDHLVLFSHFNCRSVYPYPVGSGDKKPVLDAIIADAKERNIPCRLIGLREEDKQLLNELYPGKFRIHCDRDSHDYVYDIHALAELKGRKYHSKKNHYNRFRDSHPAYIAEPLSDENLSAVKQMIQNWYTTRLSEKPDSDFQMEQAALEKALNHYKELQLEGLVLRNEDTIFAITLGSRTNRDTFDVHFEKARHDVDGAYTAINCEFADYIRTKYPEIRYLNREEDMGIEGLRKAKLSYHPHHLIVKDWACLLEDAYDY